jgi:hypothetical protein
MMRSRCKNLLLSLPLAISLICSELHAEFDPYRYIARQSENVSSNGLPEHVRITTPIYNVDLSHFRPRIGVYQYDVSWAGIPAATAFVEVTRNQKAYQVGVTVKTVRAVDLFYRLRADFQGAFAASDFAPMSGTFHARENSKFKFTHAKFLPNGEILGEHGKTGRETKSIVFNPENNTLDPFSAAFLARSMPWEEGEERVFDTYNGKSRFLVGLTCVGTDTLEVAGNNQAVWVIEPRAKKVLSEGESKLRDAKIFVTADEYRDILRIESEVFVGSVVAELASFKAYD